MSFSELHNAQRTQNTARYAEERKNAQSVTPGGKKFSRRSRAGIVVGYIVLTLLSVLWLLPIFYLLYTAFRVTPDTGIINKLFPDNLRLGFGNFRRLFNVQVDSVVVGLNSEDRLV